MAVPKIFQTFNSLLGGIVRKRNATIVGPSKQLVGEFPEVDFERLYQYYHHWDQIKTAVDVMHQKFRGSEVSIKSNNEYFNVFIEKWWDVANAEKKWSQYIYSLLITGSAIMEIQYTPDGRIGNIEQIPMQTIYRMFRDQFGNELKLVQIVDGVFKELDPEFFIHHSINNPDRQAFGKSMFHTLASPRPITGAVDPITGDSINADRNTMSLLDAQAVLQNAEIEIKKKMAKPRLVVSANGMPREQMEQIQAEMADENTDQYIWIFDKPVNSAELAIKGTDQYGKYGENVDAHIDIGTVFASSVITKPQGFSYSGGQTPLDVLDQRMIDLQSDLSEIMRDRLIKPLAESWGFKEFDLMEVKITFTPIVKRLTMEDIGGLDSTAVSAGEKRELYKKLNIELDDNMWEESKNEQKEQQAGMGMGGMPPNGQPPVDPQNPVLPTVSNPPDEDEKLSSAVPPPKVEQQAIPKDEFTIDAPKPDNSSPPKLDQRKPNGEVFVDKMIKQIANESTLSPTEKLDMLKGFERIPLAPNAINTSTDLYVGQGVDQEGVPEITDPAIRDEYGLGVDEEQEQELPPTDPSKNATVNDIATLQPEGNNAGRFTNTDVETEDVELETVSEDEYNKHIGNFTQGGTGDGGISKDSDGSYNDLIDSKQELERTPEEGNTAIEDPHARPVQEPMVNMSGGSDPIPDNTKDQIIGSNDDDEQPIVPSEGDPNDNEEEDKKIIGEAVEEDDEEFEWEEKTGDKKDVIYGEDPFTSGTSEDPTPDLDQPQKGQAQLDDTPLQEEPTTDFDKDVVGDTDQVRLQMDEETGGNPSELIPNDSDTIMDNTGLNVKPEYEQVSEDDFMKRTQDGSNPLEEEGEPLQDGMVMKPEDVQQTEPDGFIRGTNIVPHEKEPLEEDEIGTGLTDGDMNDPTLSGIDEEEVDPNLLHQDPETGINYTDLTDEQGNEVPDLRFDQNPDSDEQQPEVELEFEIVTKEEYESHLDTAMSQDEFDAELQNPTGEEPTNPFEEQTEEENPFEEQTDNVEDVDEEQPKENPFEEQTEDIDEELKDNEEVDIEKDGIDKEQDEKIKDYEQRIRKLEKMNKLDKKIGDMEQNVKKGTVKDIIKREHELLDQDTDEEEVHKILEEEFGKERMDKAQETKSWRSRK
tara:strand:- start:12654 stop:16091 length:3438 start_codon:yes stop_codon:yes gene_type:complete